MSILIELGKIVKAHGIKGEVKVLPFSGVAEDLLTLVEIELRRAGERRIFKLERIRPQGRLAIMQLTGIIDRNMAEELVGSKVWGDEESLPELGVDEFYWHEMEGLEVQTAAGRKLGRVQSLLATGAHDVLIITDGSSEYLVPVINEIMVSLDKQTGVLVIDPPPGLLEINLS
ncbi:ribosome maturation factor RimM [Desulfobacterota bacterium M19]